MSDHGGNLWAAARYYGIPVEKIIDFSASINPLGPSPAALEAIRQHLDLIRHYPDPKCAGLKEELAAHLGVMEENILLGNGSAEILYILAQWLKCQRLVLPMPTFSEYQRAFKIKQVYPFVLTADEGFVLDTDRLGGILQPGDLVILCNPNNPTSRALPGQNIVRLADRAAEVGASILVDEAFIDFVDSANVSVAREAVDRKNLLVMGSLTKFYALPGLRLGYLLGNAKTLFEVEPYAPPWRVNTLVQVAARATLKDQDYAQKTRDLIAAEKKILWQEINTIEGLHPFAADANYILVGCAGTGLTAREIQQALYPEGILIRDCSSFEHLGSDYFRIAVRSREDNEQLVGFLQRLLQDNRSAK
ncbi:MAG: threonine-phosphate decarboxylase CobD [Bacillota bacterium]